MEKPLVTGITYRVDETKISIQGIPGGSRTLNEVFEALGRQGVFVDMITQTGLVDGKTNISFTVPQEVQKTAIAVATACAKDHGAEVFVEEDIAKVSVVGIGMKYHTGVAANMFAALSSENINILMIGTSEIKISVVIARKYCEVAVRALHSRFIEDEPRIETEV